MPQSTRKHSPPKATVLIVEDDTALARAMASSLEGEFHTIHANSVAEGIALLSKNPWLVILDVVLPDANSLVLVDEAIQRPAVPYLIAISGQATADEAFELARRGVRGYLAKPFSLDELTAAIRQVSAGPTPLSVQVRGRVGVESLITTQSEVRESMLRQALAMADGNKTRAARLLGVTRQAVQQMMRELEIEK